MMFRRLGVALFLAVLLASFLMPVASGYQGQVASNVTITGPLGTITCGTGYDFAATVFDQNGNKIAGQTVTWTEIAKPVGATDTISPTTSTTDANGVAHTTITFGPPDGSRTFRAIADGAFGQIVVNVTGCPGPPPPTATARPTATPTGTVAATSPPNVTLPPTDTTEPGPTGTSGWYLWIVALVLGSLLVVASIVMARRRPSRR